MGMVTKHRRTWLPVAGALSRARSATGNSAPAPGVHFQLLNAIL